MSAMKSAAQEAAEDLFFGQSVIIWARWFVIITTVIAILWSTSNVFNLTAAVLMIVPLIAINFFVYGRYLMEKPINRNLLLILSVVDLIIVTLIVLFVRPNTGYESEYYILFYPLIISVAFVFPMRISVVYTILALILYTIPCLFVGPDAGWNGSTIETMVVRLITVGTMGVLGIFYWRVQRERRRSASSSADFAAPDLS
jgi:hypothetical protein